jgi:serine/threonine protein phosphatase PrpC
METVDRRTTDRVVVFKNQQIAPNDFIQGPVFGKWIKSNENFGNWVGIDADVTYLKMRPGLNSIFLVCDGLTDVMSSKELIDAFYKSNGNLRNYCNFAIETATGRKSTDNKTIISLKFNVKES